MTPGAHGFPLDDAALAALVRTALNEDAADRDITTIATVRAAERARARLVARQAGVISGVPLALATFRALDAEVSIRVDADDGATVAAGLPVTPGPSLQTPAAEQPAAPSPAAPPPVISPTTTPRPQAPTPPESSEPLQR